MNRLYKYLILGLQYADKARLSVETKIEYRDDVMPCEASGRATPGGSHGMTKNRIWDERRKSVAFQPVIQFKGKEPGKFVVKLRFCNFKI